MNQLDLALTVQVQFTVRLLSLLVIIEAERFECVRVDNSCETGQHNDQEDVPLLEA